MTKAEKSIHCPTGHFGHRGFSLVELLIAVTLGLLILVGVGSVFLGSKQSFRSQESLSQVQEAGRFANFMMVPYIRNAGFVDDPLSQVDPTLIFLPPNPNDNADDQLRAVWGEDDVADGTGNFWGVDAEEGTDILVVRSTGRTPFGSDPPVIEDGHLGNCLGTQGDRDQIVESIFFIRNRDNNAANPEYTLSCRARRLGAGAPIVDTQPLISGVRDMQILYGIDTDPGDDSPAPPAMPGLFPNRFVTAADIAADLTLDWQRVVAVKLEITNVGSDQTESAVAGAAVTSIDEGAADAIDNVEGRRLQRSFSTTVSIRNRLRE